jgi:2'-5' RNA ligase
VRAFLAVPSDPMWVERVGGWLAGARNSLPPASWTRAATWHLTLRVVAEISEEEAASFSTRLAPEIAAITACDLLTEGAVVLPPHGRPRVLGLGFALSTALAAVSALAVSAETAARAVGAEPEERPFRPHVTLARIRRPWPPAAVAAFRREAASGTFPPFRVRSIVFYASHLEPGGPVHTPLHEQRLTGARAGVGV